jgi:hypothetical protein
MGYKEVKTFVTSVFDKIAKAKTLDDIREIPNKVKELDDPKIKFDELKYPRINFTITKDEIASLKEIDEKHILQSNDPVLKLLYAMVWKQGDLKKISRIIEGIKNENSNAGNSVVFHQFGKHLANPSTEPIIDQHVIRAFAVYKADPSDEETINKLRKKEVLTNKDSASIRSYKEWLQTNIQKEPKEKRDYLYEIDKILFSTGKVIKV